MSSAVASEATERTDIWSFHWDGYEWQPIPEWWLDNQFARDRDELDGPPLFAVSFAELPGNTIRVRYLHSTYPKVLVCQTASAKFERGIAPRAFQTGAGWPRSMRPGASTPQDTARIVEIQHLRSIWSERVEDVPADGESLDLLNQSILGGRK